MCGENEEAKQVCEQLAGSPPRVRGKPKIPAKYVFKVGITPACAGKTIRLMVKYTFGEDHPRVCGENEPFSFMVYFQ